MRWLTGLVLQNTTAKVVSFLLAAMAWYMIREAISFEKEVTDVPVEILVDDGWAVLSLSEQSVIVTLTGPEDEVWNLDREQVKLELDIRGKPILDTMLLDLTPDLVLAPRGVRPINVEPSILYISLGQEGQREIEVEPSIQGQLPDGYELVGAECKPSTVTLYGPRQRLDEIDKLRTIPIDLEGRIQTFRLRRAIAPAGQDWVGRVDPQNVMVEVSVTMHPDIRPMEAVPIRILADPAQSGAVTFVPGEVDLILEGRGAVLEGLQPESVLAYVHGSDLVEGGTNPVPIQVHVPAGVVVKERSPEAVRIRTLE